MMNKLQDLFLVVSALIDYFFQPYKYGNKKLYQHMTLVIFLISNNYVEILQI